MNHMNLGQMADYNKGDKGFMLDTVNLAWVPIYKFNDYLIEKKLTANQINQKCVIAHGVAQ
jgi:hypothetical protein